MALKDWTEQELEGICTLKIEGYSYNDIVAKLEGGGVSTSVATLSRFFTSERGKEMLRSVRLKLTDEWKEEPLAEKFSRVHAMVEQAKRLQKMLRSYDPTDSEWKFFSSEFRNYLKQIREELDPLRLELTDNSIKSPWEEIDTVLAEKFGDEWQKTV